MTISRNVGMKVVRMVPSSLLINNLVEREIPSCDKNLPSTTVTSTSLSAPRVMLVFLMKY